VSEQTYRWSSKSLDELVTFYEREIAPERRRDGYDPTEDVPSYQWLVEHGYSGLQYAVREHHQLTLSEFFTQAVGIGEDESEDDYEWGVQNDQVIEHLEQYFRSQQRGSAAESTLDLSARDLRSSFVTTRISTERRRSSLASQMSLTSLRKSSG